MKVVNNSRDQDLFNKREQLALNLRKQKKKSLLKSKHLQLLNKSSLQDKLVLKFDVESQKLDFGFNDQNEHRKSLDDMYEISNPFSKALHRINQSKFVVVSYFF